MEEIKIRCPYCGASFTKNKSEKDYCFCSACGKRINLVKVSVKVSAHDETTDKASDETEVKTFDLEAHEKEERMRKKWERWRFAVLAGALLNVIDTVIYEFNDYEGIPIPYISFVLPLIASLFYPFKEKWTTFKCVLTWFIKSVEIWIGWSLLSLLVQFLLELILRQ